MMRRQRRRSEYAVSLFPFLAVLICTMGVLIVLLVIAVKDADVDARQAKQENIDEFEAQKNELLIKLDDQEIRIDGLSALRPEVRQRLADERLRRSHIEQQLRELRKQALQLKESWKQLDENHSIAQDSLDNDNKKFKDLSSRIELRKRQLDELRQQVASRPKMYSIVPTKSKNGTLRRPIYVECLPSHMILQPLGLVLNLDDFALPILPGNPLDAALLAIREYWNTYEAGGENGEPYPLLVIRPGGATAYAIARRAMLSWDDEFGYELVESEKQLDFGQPDENLEPIVKRAIADAMIKHRNLVALSRSQKLGGNEAKMANRFRRGVSSLVQPGGSHSGRGDRNAAKGTGESGRWSTGDQFESATNGSSNERTPSSTWNSKALSSRSTSESEAFSPGFQTASQVSKTTTQQQRSVGQYGIRGDDAKLASNSSPRLNDESWNSRGGQPGNPSNPLRRESANSANGSQTGSPTNQQSSTPKSGQPNAQANGQANGQATGNMASSSDSTQQSMPQTINPADFRPMALDRGKDWALPTRTPGATAYRRPIRVVCSGSKFMIYDANSNAPTAPIVVSSSVETAVDQLVHRIWRQIESWGLAEAGGYWKPVLRLSATPGGNQRARQLAALLEGSGLEIEGGVR